MIIVENRELLIPANERFIGTPADNHADNRVFRIRRFSQSGEDLSGLTFRLDMKYPSARTVYTFNTSTSHTGGSAVVLTKTFVQTYAAQGTYVFTFTGTAWQYDGNDVDLEDIGLVINFTPASSDTVTVVSTISTVTGDTVLLTKEITNQHINLLWEITENQTAIPGTVFVALRGSDADASVRYASFYGAFYVEVNLDQTVLPASGITELEQLENMTAEGLRKLEYLYNRYQDLDKAAEDAEAWAVGTRDGYPVGSDDDTYHNNAKYYRQYAERYAKGTEDGDPVSSGDGYHDNAKYWSEQSNDYSDLSEAFAKGTVNGIPVGPGDPGYQDNSRYYSEQSHAIVSAGLAPVFSASASYDIGDYVLHDNVLYRFTSAHAAGAWTGTDVIRVTLGEEVADVNDILDDKVVLPYLFVPHLDNDYDPTGNCFAYIYKNRCTLIDLSRYENFQMVADQLTARGVDTIDNIIITHWHGDHDGMHIGVDPDEAYDHWKNAFDCTATKLYIPRETPAAFTGDSDLGYAAVNASFAAANITILSNSTSFTWEGITFSTKNQGDGDYTYYATLSPADLNHCSALVYAEFRDCVFLDPGDLTSAGQQRCIEQGYVREANIVNIPHHGINRLSNVNFMDLIKPQYAYVSNNLSALQYGNRDGNIWKAGLTGTVFDNINNEDGIEFYFNYGVTARGTPLVNTGLTAEEQQRYIYVSESVQAGDVQDGTSQHPYKDISYVCSLCKGETTIVLLTDITSPASFTGLSGVVTVTGNSHTLNGFTAKYQAQVVFNSVTFSGTSTIELARVRFQSCTFTGDMNVYRSFVYANDVTLSNTRFANDLSYSFVTIAGISGTVGTYSYIIETPYVSTVNISGNTTGKDVKTAGVSCLYANNVVDRDTLASVTNWRHIKTLNNASGYSVKLPDGWREAYAITLLNNSESYMVPITIIKRDAPTNGSYYVRGGYAKGATETGEVILQVYNSSGNDEIVLKFAFLDGTDVKSTTSTRVYYKPGYQYYA